MWLTHKLSQQYFAHRPMIHVPFNTPFTVDILGCDIPLGHQDVLSLLLAQFDECFLELAQNSSPILDAVIPGHQLFGRALSQKATLQLTELEEDHGLMPGPTHLPRNVRHSCQAGTGVHGGS